jgi:hypothetical protein
VLDGLGFQNDRLVFRNESGRVLAETAVGGVTVMRGALSRTLREAAQQIWLVLPIFLRKAAESARGLYDYRLDWEDRLPATSPASDTVARNGARDGYFFVSFE